MCGETGTHQDKNINLIDEWNIDRRRSSDMKRDIRVQYPRSKITNLIQILTDGNAKLMKLRRTLVIFGVFAAALLLMMCADKSSSSQQFSSGNTTIPAVEAVQTRAGSLPLTERLSGSVKALNQVEIYPEVNALIQKVYVHNGDSVKQGQPLVDLRDKEISERLKQAQAAYQIAVAQERQAQARLEEVQAELRRTQTLADKDLTSDTQLETVKTRTVSAEADLQLAKARVEQAQATVDERQEALSQTVVRAPVAGNVGDRNAEIGMLVNSNTRLFTLGQLDTVRVQVVLTDRMLDYIENGQRTEIASEASSFKPISAPLSRISPFLNPVTHSTVAEIDMANPGHQLRAGMFVTVDVFYGESEKATLIPLSALYENPATGATGVYVSQTPITDEITSTTSADGSMSLTTPIPFEFVPVEVIAKGRMSAGISGVKEGEWVVTIGQELLGSQSSEARVRPIDWERVESLQRLQRQDMMDELLQEQATQRDTTTSEQQTPATS